MAAPTPQSAVEAAFSAPTVDRATAELLGAMDPGADITLLQRAIQEHGSDKVTARTMMPFAADLTPKAKQLCALLQALDFASRPAELQANLITQSVSRSIYASNHIEHLSTESVQDTERCVLSFWKTGNVDGVNAANKEHVLYAAKLMDETYKSSHRGCADPQTQFAWDVPTLLKWHSTLMVGGTEAAARATDFIAGRVREAGARTADGTRTYPHHSVLSKGLAQLGALHHALWKDVSCGMGLQKDSHGRVQWCFALASFVQFHFVDLHPFVDGNGRMCRFLSKRILEWVLPIPFPMFRSSREEYFHTLIAGGKEERALDAPRLLAELMLDEAIAYFREQITIVERSHFDRMIVADCSEELQALASDLSAEGRALLEQAFESLKANEHVMLTVDSKIIRLIRYPS